jgi:hypothetical protein
MEILKNEAITVAGFALPMQIGSHGWSYEGQITSESMEKHVYLLSENL